MDLNNTFVEVKVYKNTTLVHAFTDIPKNKISQLVEAYNGEIKAGRVNKIEVVSDGNTKAVELSAR